MPHEHKIPVYDNCTIKIIKSYNNFPFLRNVQVTVKDINGEVSESFLLDAYTEEADLFKNGECRIAIYHMKFPKKINGKIVWYHSNMAYFFNKENKIIPDDVCESRNLKFNNPNIKFIEVIMTEFGRPLCIPQEKVNITTKNSFKDIIPKHDAREPEKILYPMAGYHDPKFIGSNPHLGEQVFGFYLITEDKTRIARQINKKEFSYDGAIGYSSTIGYFISI